MDQLIIMLQQFGAEFSKFTHLDVTSILVGMIILEIPFVIRRVFSRAKGA